MFAAVASMKISGNYRFGVDVGRFVYRIVSASIFKVSDDRGIALRRFYLLSLLVVVILGGVCARGAGNDPGESDEVRQLRIYRGVLFSGANEEDRVDAAVELLLRQEKDARAILLEALGSQDNSGASRAVCMALIKGRAWGKSIRNHKDFMPALFKLLTEGDQEQVKLVAEAISSHLQLIIVKTLFSMVATSVLGRQVQAHF